MSDIKQAAELLRRWIPYGGNEDSSVLDLNEIAEAEETLANAWLQEHQSDDDEPVTEEWVFKNFPSMGEQYSARQRKDIPGLVWLDRFERFTLYDHPQPQLKTRGQVRQLVRCLTGETK